MRRNERKEKGTRSRRRKRGKAVSEAQGRLRASCEGQDEVRWNAVTVDRGPVLVQVLQGPTGPTKKNDENDEYPAAAPVSPDPEDRRRRCRRRHSLPGPRVRACVSWPNKFPSFYNADLGDPAYLRLPRLLAKLAPDSFRRRK